MHHTSFRHHLVRSMDLITVSRLLIYWRSLALINGLSSRA